MSIAFYLLYAKLEEQYGLARHAMAIYDRATRAVLPEEQSEVRYCIYIMYCVAFHALVKCSVDVYYLYQESC